MKNFALLSATALLLVACAFNNQPVESSKNSNKLEISNSSGSFVGKKVNEFASEYNNIKDSVSNNANSLDLVKKDIEQADSQYRQTIELIESKLTTGTTPSNPDLVIALNNAQKNLITLENNAQKLTAISANVIAEQEKLSALNSTINATYAIPGAYDQDHLDLNRIANAIAKQQNDTADIIAIVKMDIAREQNKADDFKNEITRLNVDVAAGYSSVSRPVLEVKEIAPIKNTLKKKALNKKSLKKTTEKINVAKAKPAEKINVAKAKPAEKINTTVAENKTLPKGAIFSIDFANDNVNYYQDMVNAVNQTLLKNPNAKIEVVTLMPMDTNQQERAQNLSAKIFGELIDISVPAENLLIDSKTDITKKNPTILIYKK